MPVYEDVLTEKDKRPCEGVKRDLKACLLDSDCVKLHKKTPKECLRSHDPSISPECYKLRLLFFECKRSLLDNRARFRGRKDF
ncbi:Uncharacterised protein g416 [Pycnogonum litorale]